MTYKEFLEHCTACGSNWIDMLLTGCRKLWPEDTQRFENTHEAFKTDNGFYQFSAIQEYLISKKVQ